MQGDDRSKALKTEWQQGVMLNGTQAGIGTGCRAWQVGEKQRGHSSSAAIPHSCHFYPFPFPTLSQSTSCHCLPALIINHFNKRFYPTCQPIPSSRVRHPVFAHPVCILSTEQQSSPSDMQVRAECVNELNCFTEFRGLALRVQPQVSNTPEERMKMEEGCSLWIGCFNEANDGKPQELCHKKWYHALPVWTRRNMNSTELWKTFTIEPKWLQNTSFINKYWSNNQMRLEDELFAHFLHFEKYDRCNSILLTFNILHRV